MSAFGDKADSARAVEFHGLYVGAITGSGDATVADRRGASGCRSNRGLHAMNEIILIAVAAHVACLAAAVMGYLNGGLI
jgi:hypothetical protein